MKEALMYIGRKEKTSSCSEKVFKRVLLFLLICSVSILGKTENSTFRQLTSLEGLSQNDVNCIFQDSRGYIWVGTHDGLNRYDGYEFKTYQITPDQKGGIPSNLIFRIEEDSFGNLWLGSSDKGILQFNVSENRFYRLNDLCEEENPQLSGNRIGALHIDKTGNIWLGTNSGVDVLIPLGKGKYKLIKSKDIYDAKNGLYGLNILSFFEDDDGSMFICGVASLNYCRYSELSNKNIKLEQIDVSGYGNVYNIGKYKNNYLLFSSVGVNILYPNYENEQFVIGKKISDKVLRTCLITKNGELWAGELSKGLYNFSLSLNSKGKISLIEKKYFDETDLSKPIVNSLFEDRDGLIWVGLNGGGIQCYVRHRSRFRSYRKTDLSGSLVYNKIRAIYEDNKKNLWVGTEGGGVSLLPNNAEKEYETGFIHKEIQEQGSKDIYCFGEYKNSDEILVGAGFPIRYAKLKFSGKDIKVNDPDFVISSHSIFDIYTDSLGVVWLASYGTGLFAVYPVQEGAPQKILNYRNNPKDTNSISSDVVRSITEDKSGNLWIGTDKGVNKLKFSEKYTEHPNFISYKRENNKQSITHDYILPIIRTSKDEIWFGTMGGGLNKLIPGEQGNPDRFEAITEKDGLPSNVIKAIIEDDKGFLWISSNRGLTKFNPETKEIRNFDINDGLQDYEFGELAACKRADGEILFGGVNGFNAFYPGEIVVDTFPPSITITELLILNQSIEVGEEFNGRVILEESINTTEHIRLKYSENSIAFQFSALHYAAPSKNQYRYKLEGFDYNWVKADSDYRIAKYTYLPPGDYKFLIEGSNLDGIWCKKPASINITVTPPWWRSIIAYISYIVILVLILILFVRYNKARNKRKTELKMERFEKEKIKELSSMKLRFYTNISHEFRTPLTLILGPLEKLIKEGINFSEEKRQNNYSIIHRNSSILLRLINQLMDFRKFEQEKMDLLASFSDVNKLINEVFLSFKELAERKNIRFIQELPNNKVQLWFDKDKLEKILYNLLSNAFKFTPTGGAITLSLNEYDSYVSIAVKDTGYGMTEETQKHVFERFYQSKRIQNQQVGSTGIGLAFTKGLVELHKGTIDFESKVNEGTTFFVELPKGDTHLKKENKLPEANISIEKQVYSDNDYETFKSDDAILRKEGEKNVFSGYKILIVEDNDDLRNFLVEQFNVNYSVTEAVDGQQGVDKCMEEQPDIVISDVMMPRMDGYDLCSKIKETEETSHIPVVLLTAKTSPEYQLKGFNIGADAYVAKPFQFSILKARIEAILKSRAQLRNKYQGSTEIQPSEIAMTSIDERFLERIVRIIEEKMNEGTFTVEQLSTDYGMTQSLLNKKLRSLTGLNSKAFIRSIRMKRAAQLLKLGRYTVADVTYEVGMNDLKYFRQCFKAEFGLTPSEFMKANKE